MDAQFSSMPTQGGDTQVYREGRTIVVVPLIARLLVMLLHMILRTSLPPGIERSRASARMCLRRATRIAKRHKTVAVTSFSEAMAEKARNTLACLPPVAPQATDITGETLRAVAPTATEAD